ncbi:MAG: ankyrin repeat domain-containing protein [Ignavibacteriales bacterium]|nr:ankyrin repeat domain-containing protein [Ignavibacteriales bacterium]
MVRPNEMEKTLPIELHGGVVSTSTDVWSMLIACHDGDLDRVKELLGICPALLTCQYDYTAPLHFAVREGHLDIVRFLVSCRALDPTYLVHPFRDSLLTIAQDRGHVEIARYVSQSLNDTNLIYKWGDTGKIDHRMDESQRSFQHLVDKHHYVEAEAMLKYRPELALYEFAFWGEGILAMPAKDADFKMLELLMRYGAKVPQISKWGARYYFRHYEVAVFLLKNGMDPNHMNWRGFRLLHDMAYTGDVQKARLLLDHGADIDPIDDEYSTTPLGYAARWGHQEVAALLLERGADATKAGGPWATPLAWARKRGHASIEAILLRQGGVRG